MLLQVWSYSSWEQKALILSSLSKIQVDEFDRFFFGHLLPGNCSVIVGVIIPHQFDGMLHRNVVLSHEVGDLWVRFDFPGGLCSLSPGGVISLRRGSSSPSFPWVSSMLGQMVSLLVADEALLISDVLRPFTRREIDLFYIHSIGVGARVLASWQNITVSPSSEFPKLYHVAVEFSCFIKPLLPFPTNLFLSVREGSSSHHDSKLLGDPSLEGINQDAVIVYSTVCLGKFEGSGVLIKVSDQLVHTEGIDSLASSVLEVFWDEGFFIGFAYLFKGFLRVRDGRIG